MPAYTFEALDAQGRSRKGVLEAETARAARTALRGQGLVPLQVDAVGGPEARADGTAGTSPRSYGGGLLLRRAGVRRARAGGLDAPAGRPGVSSGLPLERALTALV
jgi:general secretion pathway protein F